MPRTFVSLFGSGGDYLPIAAGGGGGGAGPAARTGTASQVDASAGNGSTAVTVPVTATTVVAFVSQWDGDTGTKLATLTLNGSSFTEQIQLTEGATTGEAGVGVFTLINPTTGSQTLAWTWSAGGARTEGGEIALVYVTGANHSDLVRDSDAVAETTNDNTTLTLTTSVGDLLLAFAMSANSNPGLDATVFIANTNVNSHFYDVSDITASAGSTAINMSNENYSSMSAISLKSNP